MSVQSAIVTLLTGDAELTELLASNDSVYENQAPERAEFPYIIFQRQSGIRSWSFQGAPMRPEVWLVKAITHSKTSRSARDIDSRIEALLGNATLSIPGSTLLGKVRRDTDVSYVEPVGLEMYQHIGGTYRLTHQVGA